MARSNLNRNAMSWDASDGTFYFFFGAAITARRRHLIAAVAIVAIVEQS